MNDDNYRFDEREEVYRQLAQGQIEMGDAIRRLRKILKIKQRDFAKTIGIDIRVLSDFERSQGNLRTSTIAKIITPFGLKLTARRI